MNPGLAAVIGLIVGAGLAGLIIWLRVRPRPEVVDPFGEPDPVAVPEGVNEVLAALHSPAVVIGPHDEVLQSTASSRSHGLVRGSRVANRDVLGMVRAVRQDRRLRSADLQLGSGAGTIFLTTRVAPLAGDLILVLADDRTAEHRVEETRRDFVANVSHELKTPIGAVSLLAEALEQAADDPAAVQKFAGRLSVESSRLNVLVGQIIDLSRLQADDPLLAPEVVDIDQILATAADRCRVDAERRGVNLTVAGPSGCRVLGSERQLITAIGNLVENAVVYSDSGARVALAAHTEAASDDDYVEITVSDNGIGIGPADLDRIFERFYRVDYGRSRDNGGTGLGLSIVKHVAASHRGEVRVWSQPGQGSTFTLRIPAHLHLDQHSSRPTENRPTEHRPDVDQSIQPSLAATQTQSAAPLTQEITR